MEKTLTDEEYIRLGELAVAEVRRYIADLSSWSSVSSKNGNEMFERKSDKPGTVENMLLLITDLPCLMEKVEKMMVPWEPYRVQWDQMLEKVEIVKQWKDQEAYLTRHLIEKQSILSPRESIDVVKVQRSGNEIIVGSTGTTHGDYPHIKDYVRTHQTLGGYLMRPSDMKPGHTKFHMLFHADLNLPVPRFLGNLIAKFKPDLMVKKTESLKEAIQKFDI